MIKRIVVLCVAAILIVIGTLYGYKLGVRDSAAYSSCFTEIGFDHTYLKVLKEKDAEHLCEFIESSLDSAIPNFLELHDNQSIFSKYIGPIKESNEQRELFLSIYQGINDYKKLYPSQDSEPEVSVALEKLISQLNIQ